ncbi:MAG: hypothetical protein JWN04_5061 [Myxococcaceae bacterium]|nr:hypothetical protein [Myxococcaceae bacterium]
MKSVDTLTSPLELAPTQAGEAMHKDLRAQSDRRAQAGHFDALLAQASDHEAAAGKRTTEPVAQKTASAVDDRSLTLPVQTRSIHDSITRTTRGLAARTPAQSVASGATLQSADSAASIVQPAAVTLSASQALSDEHVSVRELDDSVEPDGGAQALQAVLGQVATVVAAIVAPAANVAANAAATQPTSTPAAANVSSAPQASSASAAATGSVATDEPQVAASETDAFAQLVTPGRERNTNPLAQTAAEVPGAKALLTNPSGPASGATPEQVPAAAVRSIPAATPGAPPATSDGSAESTSTESAASTQLTASTQSAVTQPAITQPTITQPAASTPAAARTQSSANAYFAGGAQPAASLQVAPSAQAPATQPTNTQAQPSEAADAPAAQPRVGGAQPKPAVANPVVSVATPGQQQAASSAAVAVGTLPLAVQPQTPAVASDAPSGRDPRASAKTSGAMDDRIQGFTRGALGGSVSAYAARTQTRSDQESSTPSKHAEELDEQADHDSKVDAASSFNVVPVLLPDPANAQLAGSPVEAPRMDLPMPQPSAPVPTPAAPPAQVEFAARAPGSQTENASISIHHPDLGPIQLEVHRDHGRVEVHAVIESAHAEAVLRANESGIRQGVQQSGMTFSALRVRVRGEDHTTARPAQPRKRRANERE